MSISTIESNLQEERLFSPPTAFARQAHIVSFEAYQQLCEDARNDREGFWGRLARQELHWFVPWERVLDWQPPFAQWFVGGKLNVAYNCFRSSSRASCHQTSPDLGR